MIKDMCLSSSGAVFGFVDYVESNNYLQSSSLPFTSPWDLISRLLPGAYKLLSCCSEIIYICWL
uniref:Uncharacterized protein n=1 Tax=Arundo donax TaxID=35708 RepID=A0A0A9H649_ARUDO